MLHSLFNYIGYSLLINPKLSNAIHVEIPLQQHLNQLNGATSYFTVSIALKILFVLGTICLGFLIGVLGLIKIGASCLQWIRDVLSLGIFV